MTNPWEFPEEKWEEGKEPEIDQRAGKFSDAEKRLDALLNENNPDPDTLDEILKEMGDPLDIRTIRKSSGAVSEKHLRKIQKIIRATKKRGEIGKAS